jgi:hypothetical protein
MEFAGRIIWMSGQRRLTPAGAEIVEALTEFYEALKQGPEAVAKRFTVRTVELDPKPRLDLPGRDRIS